MKLNTLSIAHKEFFNRFLLEKRHELSVYCFENIYIWKSLYAIRWAQVDDTLCVFFLDALGCFLYTAPLGKGLRGHIAESVFRVMDTHNRNKEVSRIENIEAKDADFYKDAGYDCRIKSYDYLCERSTLAGLKGDAFKSKRASSNYFTKHYRYTYVPFRGSLKKDCITLYRQWEKQRKEAIADRFYQGMLEDSFKSLKVLLDNYQDLGLIGRVVLVEGAVKGFTFGARLNKDTLCIIYEITDLTVKGLAQFVFKSLCRELQEFKYVNVMDDSGLENLKKVKLSYHPVKLIPAYIARRKHA